MRIIYNHYVMKYVPVGHTGPKPNVWARLTRNEAYRLYMSRIAGIRDDLSGTDNVQELIAILTTQYDLPIKRARDFVNKNATREWRKADYEGRLAVLLRVNRDFLSLRNL